VSVGCAPDRAGDAAACVLGALEPQEADAFLRHAGSCIVCRDELQQFGSVVDALALAVPQQEAPARLRRVVMREVRRSLGSATSRPARRPAAEIRWPRLRDRGPVAALLGGVAVAMALLAIVLGAPGSPTPAARTFAATLHGVRGSAELRLGSNHSALIVRGMPEPALGRIYEVWVRHGHGAVAATDVLFGVTSSGSALVEVPGNPSTISEVLVTEEPSGGTRAPTTAPLITVALRD
jgi:hypothetical protein